jgi:hypothetical protein
MIAGFAAQLSKGLRRGRLAGVVLLEVNAMLLVVDTGNTNTVMAVRSGDQWRGMQRSSTSLSVLG